MKKKYNIQGRTDDYTYLLTQIIKVNEYINRPVTPALIFDYRIAYSLNKEELIQLGKETEHIGWSV